MITLSKENREILKYFITHQIPKAIVAKGKSVLNKITVIEMSEYGEISAHVNGSNYENYEVQIQINEDDEVDASCSCYYYGESFENCKHIAAVALECTKTIRTQEEIDEAKKTAASVKVLNEKMGKNSEVGLSKSKEELPLIGMEYKMNGLPEFRNMYPLDIANKALGICNSYYDYSIEMSTDGKRFDLVPQKGKLKTFVQKVEKKNHFVVGCNCRTFKAIEPCFHILGLLLKVNNLKGKYYFNQFEDFTVEKNKLLEPYGITLEDELAKEFKFGVDASGNPWVSSKPQGLLPIFSDVSTDWKAITEKLPTKKVKGIKDLETDVVQTSSAESNKQLDPFDTAILFNLNQNAINGFRIDSFKITQKGEKSSYTNNKLKYKEDLSVFNNAPSAMQNALFNIVEENLVRLLRENTNSYNISDSQPYRNLDAKQWELINAEYTNTLRELAPYLANWKQLYYLPDGKSFAKCNILPCKFANDPLDYKVALKQNEKTISLEVEIYKKETGVVISNYTKHKFLVLHNDVFYFIPNGINQLKKYFPEGKLMVPLAAKNEFINKIVLPLTSKFPIEMGDVVTNETIEPFPEPRVYLSELNEKYLIISPKWLYAEYEMDNDGEEITTLELGDKLLNISRNPTEENKLIENLRTLHPSFKNQNNEHFYLHFDEVMKKNWFFMMYQQLQEMEIPLFGFSNLNKFKYNTNKPVMDFKAGSGTDWFDIKMQVNYGDQIVPLATLRKAIINKQQFVLLSDGTLGMLPDEWIKKFASLMRMGTVKDDALQVSKLHWTVIDQLHEQEDNEAVYQEILAKKRKA